MSIQQLINRQKPGRKVQGIAAAFVALQDFGQSRGRFLSNSTSSLLTAWG